MFDPRTKFMNVAIRHAAQNDQSLDGLMQHDCVLCLLNLPNGRQSNITITVTTLDQVLDSVEELGTFEACSPSGSSAVVDFNAALCRTLLETI